MVLRLRLARVSGPNGARRHKPFYNIVLAHDRTARDGKPMEVLGTYNPIPQTPVGATATDRKVKDVKLDVSRTKYWLGVGAQPSETVWRLLAMIGLLEPRYLAHGPQSLKAARFPSHHGAEVGSAEESTKEAKSGRPVTEMLKKERRREVPASNTSSMDPNAT